MAARWGKESPSRLSAAAAFSSVAPAGLEAVPASPGRGAGSEGPACARPLDGRLWLPVPRGEPLVGGREGASAGVRGPAVQRREEPPPEGVVQGRGTLLLGLGEEPRSEGRVGEQAG